MIKIKVERKAENHRPTIHFMIGLQGSGKSAKALELVKKDITKSTLRINKDDLRTMMRGIDYTWNRIYERIINSTSNAAGVSALELGYNVVIDDMGFNNTYRKYWMDYAKKYNLNLISYFADTDLETCEKRCTYRHKQNGNPITAEIVKGSAEKYKDIILSTRNGIFI